MAKRRVEDILYDENSKNKECDKIKIRFAINQGKSAFISPRELANYYYVSSR